MGSLGLLVGGVNRRADEADMQRDKIKGEARVGYKRPPAETRFKKGQSGNPRGRRRAPATIAGLFTEELQSTVVISENGQRRKVQKIRVLINEAIKKAMKGNFQPLVLMTKISHSLEQLTSPANPLKENQFDHLSDEELREHVIREIRELFPEEVLPAKRIGNPRGDD
jgi:hypothetical protein